MAGNIAAIKAQLNLAKEVAGRAVYGEILDDCEVYRVGSAELAGNNSKVREIIKILERMRGEILDTMGLVAANRGYAQEARDQLWSLMDPNQATFLRGIAMVVSDTVDAFRERPRLTELDYAHNSANTMATLAGNTLTTLSGMEAGLVEATGHLAAVATILDAFHEAAQSAAFDADGSKNHQYMTAAYIDAYSDRL